MKNIAFYAGSFDPFTIGHLELVKKASKLFNKVIIGIGINPDKKPRFDKNEMKLAIEETLKIDNLSNCEVAIYEGYTYEAAKQNNSHILIRGLRNKTDYKYEEEIAKFNDNYEMETIYLRAGDLGNVSSSFVYQELQNNNDVSLYVPEPVKKLILKDNNK